MIELAGRDGLYQRGLAGDSFNTAIYLARAGLTVDYLTRLGDDPASDDIIALLEAEHIGISQVTHCPGRQPGLYIIDNDAAGERYFSYWRDHSPARELFAATPQLDDIDVFFFTGITLAITRSGFDNLLQLLATLNNRDCKVIFDPNYRPALWHDAEQAREHIQQVLPWCHTALPTLEDDTALWGIKQVNECRRLYLDAGVKELVIKGADLVTYAFAGESTLEQQAEAVAAIDTTGAGDAFNAGYLASRLTGGDLQDAVTRAQALSRQVVQHRGAILPRHQEQR